MKDQYWMRQALKLAARGRGQVAPNPLAGAVIVKNDTLLAEGWHARYGEAHAEQMAIAALSSDELQGATMYVTLEPCTHVGKTPACSSLIIDSGIHRVVIAAKDPNPIAAGGIEQLKAAGLMVTVGVLAEEAEKQNKVFFHNQRHQLPYICWKVASTLDGCVTSAAPLEDKTSQISNTKSTKQVHLWRHQTKGIMIGAGTLRNDNPSLTDRSDQHPPQHPIRIIVGRHPEDLATSHIFATAADIPTIFATTAPLSACTALIDAQIEVLSYPGGNVPLPILCRDLYHKGITDILLEGGATLAAEMLKEGLVNEVAICFAAKLLGQSNLSQRMLAPLSQDLSAGLQLNNLRSEQIDNDLWIYGQVVQ